MKVVVTIVGTIAYFLIFFIIKFVIWDMFPDWAAEQPLINLEILMAAASTGIVSLLISGLLRTDDEKWDFSVLLLAGGAAFVNFILISFLPASISLGIIINIVNIAVIAIVTHFTLEA